MSVPIERAPFPFGRERPHLVSSAAAEQPISLLGTSLPLARLRHEVEVAGRCDSKVLITGESGSGKEVAAQAIHACSARRRQRMLAINCAGFPDSLLESELFGHQRGSFTGAMRDRPGLIETADGSTLFMDEVCEMSLRMQALLLRFLETGETHRVGADQPGRRFDVRILAATNRDIDQRIAAGEFREDLYFRLNVLHIEVPSLRERLEDIPALLDYFLQLYAAKGGSAPLSVGPGVLERLMAHRWPGNIRELRNAVEGAVLRAQGGVISVDDLPSQFRAAPSPPVAATAPVTGLPAHEVLFERMVVQGESFWSAVRAPFMARDLTRHDVREVVRLGLERTQGSYRAVVQLFNMTEKDYKRFLNFLRTFGCELPFHAYREPQK
jgi:transcriptional regulator with PAS, ATPase and Fis domain